VAQEIREVISREKGECGGVFLPTYLLSSIV
jgi:hypothetical protein